MRFEDLTDDGFGALQGGSQQVLGEAFANNTGAALTEYDLFPEGRYPIHSVPGQYTLFAQKDSKNQLTFVTAVEDSAMKAWEEDVARDRAFNEIAGKDQRCRTNVPPWIMAAMMFNHDVMPEDPHWEKTLKQHYPRCYLTD